MTNSEKPTLTSKTMAERIAERVVLEVCELPDYNSPEDQPDLVMCTVQELNACVLRAFEQLEYDREMERGPPAHETLPPRITVMDDGRAMGGSDVCHTCAAHCTVINDMQTALRGLYWDNVDYLTLNKLGGMQNHWMRAARLVLDMDADDVRPSHQKASEGRS